MAVVGNAGCVPIRVRVRMPRASIHASSSPRGCLSIFNLSVESASRRDVIAAGSIPRSMKGLDRIEIFEDEEPLISGFPGRLVSREEDLFSSDFALSTRRCHCGAAASLLLPCLPRSDRPVFYTMLIASLYPPHFATYLFSSLRGGTLWTSGNNLWVYRGSNNSFRRGGHRGG